MYRSVPLRLAEVASEAPIPYEVELPLLTEVLCLVALLQITDHLLDAFHLPFLSKLHEMFDLSSQSHLL